jgi:ADP-ribose pyrophosphatase YjhB (NUDIX family)
VSGPPGRPRSTEASFFRFCPRCATPLTRRLLEGVVRAACPACAFVQYRNPVVGVAAVILESDVVALLGEEAVRPFRRTEGGAPRVLLARRALTFRGRYCFPCGYVEFDEEIREALVRETREETGLEVALGGIAAAHSNFHDPDGQSVGIWFYARPTGGALAAGDDVDALLFVPPSDPGVPIAFPTDALVLEAVARLLPPR